MEALGIQLLIELYGCDPQKLTHVPEVEAALLEFAEKSGATIISSHFHQFNPVGVSGVILIKESHFTIHTWPEHQYAAVDVFTCGEEFNTDNGLPFFQERLEAAQISVKKVLRGEHIPKSLPPTAKTT